MKRLLTFLVLMAFSVLGAFAMPEYTKTYRVDNEVYKTEKSKFISIENENFACNLNKEIIIHKSEKAINIYTYENLQHNTFAKNEKAKTKNRSLMEVSDTRRKV